MQIKLAQLIATAKNTPELGKLDPGVKAAVRARLMQRINESSVQAVQPSVFDYLRAPFHGVDFRMVMQPVTALGVMLALSVGWVGSVFASMNSVPGDMLYNLKIASERAQLTLADSETSRTRLHIEFANRRAEEVTVLLETKKPNHEARVKVAMGNLKSELKTVSDHLTTLKAEDTQAAVSLAKLVDRKVGALEQTIQASLENATDAVKQDAVEVQDVVQIAGAQALTVLVKEGAVPESSLTAAEALEKKAADEVAKVKAELAEKAKQFKAGQNAFKARAARLPILSEKDLEIAGEWKQAEEKLAEAQAMIEESEQALVQKDLVKAIELAKSAAAFQVPANEVAPTESDAEVKAESSAPAESQEPSESKTTVAE